MPGRDFGTTAVLVSANPEQATGTGSVALGVICKPFDIDTISGVLRFVENYLRERRLAPGPLSFRLTPGPAPDTAGGA